MTTFSESYIQLLNDLGIDCGHSAGFAESELKQWELANELSLPRALRDYYLSVGALPFNQALEHLRTPTDLVRREGRVEFMDENQGTVIWAVLETDCTKSNPEVFEGISVAGPVPWEWRSTMEPCSGFFEGDGPLAVT